MWNRLAGAPLAAALALTIVGCTTKPRAPEAVIEDKVFAVTPATEEVKVGILAGKMTGMKITEQVDKASGRVDSPPRLSGTLELKNGSSDQSASAIVGKVQYIGTDGKPIALEDQRTNLSISSSAYGADAERLDPGQTTTKSIDLDFPAAALQPKKLKDIRLELTYIPSAYKDETVDLPVTIAAGK